MNLALYKVYFDSNNIFKMCGQYKRHPLWILVNFSFHNIQLEFLVTPDLYQKFQAKLYHLLWWINLVQNLFHVFLQTLLTFGFGGCHVNRFIKSPISSKVN